MALFCRENMKRILFIFIRLSLTLIFILSCPLILLSWGILTLYRNLIRKFVQRGDSTVGDLVSPISNIFVSDDIYENSYTTNIALHVVGKIDKPHLIHGFEKLLTSTRISEDGTLLYPELTQRIVKRFGYNFWKNYSFKVEDHIKYLNEKEPDSEMTLEEIRELIGKFGKTPLDKERSPWVVFVVKNFKCESDPKVKSVIILRLHHCMFDGQSILNVFSKMADKPLNLPYGNLANKDKEKISSSIGSGAVDYLKKIILRPLVLLIRGPYELVGQLMSFDYNELVRKNRRDFKGLMRFHECEPISLNELKALKNHFGVSLSALLTTLSARALKRFMEKRNIKEKKIHMTFPLPVSHHPDKLRNYFAGGIISIDCSHDDRLKLLLEIEKKLHKFKYALISGLPEASVVLLKVLGSLPNFLLPKIDNLSLSCTLMNSVIPGPVNTGYFCGFPIVDATVAGSISKPYPIGSLSYSYRGYYKFGFSADASLMEKVEDIKELGNTVLEEFQEFQMIIDEKINNIV